MAIYSEFSHKNGDFPWLYVYIYIYVNVYQRVVQQFREKYESHRLYVIKQF